MKPSSVKIKSIRKITLKDPVPVYDIEVPEFHNFTLSNGLVVHNSKDTADSLAGAVYSASKSVSQYSTFNSIDSFDSGHHTDDELSLSDDDKVRRILNPTMDEYLHREMELLFPNGM